MQGNRYLLTRHDLVYLLGQKIDDLFEVFIRQGLKQDDLIQAVEELGIENPLYLSVNQFLGFLSIGVRCGPESQMPSLLEEAGSDIGSHDDDAIFEVDRITERVG